MKVGMRLFDIDWSDPAWIAAAVALAALMLSVISVTLSWRSLRWDRQSSEAALRSAEAAERANRLTERMVEHQIEQARAASNPASDQQISAKGIPSGEAFGTPTVTQAAADVSWQIEHPSGSRYVLRNTGTDIADHVEVDATEVGPITRNLPRGSVIRPGEGADMLIAGTFGHPRPNQLYVRWAGQPEWVAVPMPN
ncbi:hypothetical protein [Mycolicibacterium pyrenivorans]|uniref:hypothetical protein n=1 Tax=Mycolicibacterium pyrenivorans TaxID=187102 RepID=UPI0021F27CB7|nr:hypothetical protein [Mycolicibacterium pyrenivorans]MCV7154337.1 hypothetical protein [Mycolicibacterium pyrenivorans]